MTAAHMHPAANRFRKHEKSFAVSVGGTVEPGVFGLAKHNPGESTLNTETTDGRPGMRES